MGGISTSFRLKTSFLELDVEGVSMDQKREICIGHQSVDMSWVTRTDTARVNKQETQSGVSNFRYRIRQDSSASVHKFVLAVIWPSYSAPKEMRDFLTCRGLTVASLLTTCNMNMFWYIANLGMNPSQLAWCQSHLESVTVKVCDNNSTSFVQIIHAIESMSSSPC